MNIRWLRLMVLPVLALGCGKQQSQSSSVEEKVKAIMDVSIAILTPPELCVRTNEYTVAEEALRQVRVISNQTVRVRLIERYADILMAMNISGFGYGQQGNKITLISKVVWDNVVGELFMAGADLDSIYNMRFRLLEWMRAQLARLRPTKKVNINYWKSEEEFRKYREWSLAYEHLYSRLKVYLFCLENDKWIIHADLYRRPNARREDVRAKIEAWLGHPMRSEDELRKARKLDTEDYKKVRYGCWAPDDIKN